VRSHCQEGDWGRRQSRKVVELAMVALSVSLGPRTPEALIEEVGRLSGVV
jgi:hypothetical protein